MKGLIKRADHFGKRKDGKLQFMHANNMDEYDRIEAGKEDEWDSEEIVKVKARKTKFVVESKFFNDASIAFCQNGKDAYSFDIVFRSTEEVETEEEVECNLGHKHPKRVVRDFNYESLTITREQARALGEWLLGKRPNGKA